MKNHYIPTREVWEFEKYLASKPDVWRAEATNLRYSVEALFLYDQEVHQRILIDKTTTRLPTFFSARVERMLMGFALENLVKSALLQNPRRLIKVFGQDGNLSWGKDGHDLLKLFSEANIQTTKIEKTYLELWQLCALWAGRYPLPANEHNLPKQRKPRPSREALLARSQKRIEQAIAEGDQLLGAEIFDLMHSGVGTYEMQLFQELFKKCDSLLPVL